MILALRMMRVFEDRNGIFQKLENGTVDQLITRLHFEASLSEGRFLSSSL